MDSLFYIVPAAAVIALFFAWYFFHQMMKESEGTATMKEIAQYVRDGAMAYLKQQMLSLPEMARWFLHIT